MTLGEKIKKYRKEAKLTQQEIADKLGIIQSNIHRWEANKVIPSTDTLKKISKILNISIDTLLFTKKERKKFKNTDKNLIEKLNQLPPEHRTTIADLIDKLLK